MAGRGDGGLRPRAQEREPMRISTTTMLIGLCLLGMATVPPAIADPDTYLTEVAVSDNVATPHSLGALAHFVSAVPGPKNDYCTGESGNDTDGYWCEGVHSTERGTDCIGYYYRPYGGKPICFGIDPRSLTVVSGPGRVPGITVG